MQQLLLQGGGVESSAVFPACPLGISHIFSWQGPNNQGLPCFWQTLLVGSNIPLVHISGQPSCAVKVFGKEWVKTFDFHLLFCLLLILNILIAINARSISARLQMFIINRE